MLGVGLIGSTFTALQGQLVLPGMDQFLRDFGVEDPPLLTSAFIHGHLLLWLLPAAALLAWFLWPRREHRARVACLVGVVSVVIVLPLMYLALYLPVARLADTI